MGAGVCFLGACVVKVEQQERRICPGLTEETKTRSKGFGRWIRSRGGGMYGEEDSGTKKGDEKPT